MVSWTGLCNGFDQLYGQDTVLCKTNLLPGKRGSLKTRSTTVCIQMNMYRCLSSSSFCAALFVVINDDNIVLADCSHSATKIFLLLNCMLSCC